MFGWIKTRRDSKDNESTRGMTRRAFRPQGDRLESREVLSLFAVPGGTAVQFAPGMAFRAPSNGFTGLTSNISRVPGVFSNTSTLLNSTNAATSAIGNTAASAIGNTAAGFANLLPGLSSTSALVGTGNNTTPSAFSTSASLAPLTGGSTASNVVHTSLASARTLPREAGLQSNVNTRLPNAGRAGGTFFPASSFPQSALSGALSGLAFSTPSSATNGVAFSTPNSVTSGVGFSNLFSAGNGALSGLSFTNSSGFSRPAGAFNPATNGLSFSGGTAFANPNTNPFRLF